MIFKNFRIQCVLRVLLISATVCLLIYLLSRTNLVATTFIVSVAVVYQIYGLIHHVEKTNRDLTRFFRSIKYSDFSQSFAGTPRGSSFKELNEAFTEVINKFKKTRAEKEEHFRYLQTVIQHIGIGLIAFRQDGDVDLINNVAKKLLRVSRLRNIKDLESVNKNLVNTLFRLKHGDNDLIKFKENDEEFQLSVYATDFVLRKQRYALVSIQNIQSELEEKEMEAWQNLIRVLTHEIMNSVAPISSLASTANSLLKSRFKMDESDRKPNVDIIKDVSSAVQTIEKRSQSLISFVENYRKLTRIPKPNFQIFKVVDLFERVNNLMKAQLEKQSIDLKMRIEPETLELTADPDLIEQVLINLVKNGIDAVKSKSKPVIELMGNMDERGRVVIKVFDNGQGIKEEVLENVFIPFFTTKKQGSGIGLSLSRQIMRLHNGSISVKSKLEAETVITLRF